MKTDWSSIDIAVPATLGFQVIESQDLHSLVEFIDWTPFFLTWELRGKYPRIFDHPELGEPARELFDNAQEIRGIVNGLALIQSLLGI